MAKVRVLLADDHALIADAFKKLLEPEFEVVGVASDGRKLLQSAREIRPDVVLLDLGMPLLNGFDAGQQLKNILPATKIIVVTMNNDVDTADAALREWASGYVLKSSDRTELSKAISSVMNGKRYITEQITNQRSERFSRDPSKPHARVLTRREREVLQLLAEGLSMKQAAAELQVTSRTIAFHKYRIMNKCRIGSSFELVLFAIKQQIVAAETRHQAATSSQ